MNKGKHSDPKIVEVFLEHHAEFKRWHNFFD